MQDMNVGVRITSDDFKHLVLLMYHQIIDIYTNKIKLRVLVVYSLNLF